jgi:hypothetical protein
MDCEGEDKVSYSARRGESVLVLRIDFGVYDYEIESQCKVPFSREISIKACPGLAYIDEVLG